MTRSEAWLGNENQKSRHQFNKHASLLTSFLSLVTCHCSLSVASRQAEHKVADDVALNLAGAGFDGVAARAQVAVRPFAMIDGVRACAAKLPIRAEHLHSDLLHA